MIPCHSAALRCTWPFAVTCMTPSSIENEIAHLTVAAFSSHLSRLRREERLVMTAYLDVALGVFEADGVGRVHAVFEGHRIGGDSGDAPQEIAHLRRDQGGGVDLLAR